MLGRPCVSCRMFAACSRLRPCVLHGANLAPPAPPGGPQRARPAAGQHTDHLSAPGTRCRRFISPQIELPGFHDAPNHIGLIMGSDPGQPAMVPPNDLETGTGARRWMPLQSASQLPPRRTLCHVLPRAPTLAVVHHLVPWPPLTPLP